MPTASVEVGKETMRGLKRFGVLSIQGFGEDTDFAKRFERGGVGGDVEAVLGGQEHRAGGEHDGRIIENPTVIKSDEVVNRLCHERMPLFRKHEIIGNADGYSFGEDDREDEEGVERAKTADVQVDVHASIVMENEISNGVGPLDGVGIGIEGV